MGRELQGTEQCLLTASLLGPYGQVITSVQGSYERDCLSQPTHGRVRGIWAEKEPRTPGPTPGRNFRFPLTQVSPEHTRPPATGPSAPLSDPFSAKAKGDKSLLVQLWPPTPACEETAFILGKIPKGETNPASLCGTAAINPA